MNIRSLSAIITLVFFLSGCTALQDIDYGEKEEMTFKVEEVKIKDIVDSDPTIQARSEELIGIKEQIKKKQQSGVTLSDDWSVIAPSLNIRSEANSDSEMLGTLSLGEKVVQVEEKIDGNGEKWIAFMMEDGSKGYVSAKYLSKSVAEQPIAIYRVVIYNLNIRSEASEEAEILGELTYFNEFSVFEKVTDQNGKVWLKTQAPGSESGYGYVMSDFAVIVE